jgi:hypothetical protein
MDLISENLLPCKQRFEFHDKNVIFLNLQKSHLMAIPGVLPLSPPKREGYLRQGRLRCLCPWKKKKSVPG